MLKVHRKRMVKSHIDMHKKMLYHVIGLCKRAR